MNKRCARRFNTNSFLSFLTLVLSLFGASWAQSQPADTTAPTVASFAFNTANSTEGTFNITFSEPVTGIGASDFYGVSTGNTSATVVSATPGTGNSYTIGFTYTGNTGELQLRIHASGTGIVDAAGNAFAGAGATSSGVVQNTNRTGDTAAPTVVAFAPSTPSGGTVFFTVNFNEPVNGVTASSFTVTGGTIASVVSTGTAGTASLVTVNYSGTTGSVTLALNAANYAAIRDFNNNAYAGGGTTSATATIGGGTSPAAPVILGVTTDTGVPNDGITSSLSYTLYGTAPPNSTVSIYWGGSTTTSVTTTAAADGTWRSSTYTRTEYPLGTDQYEATATTSAGVSPRSAPFTLRLIPAPEVNWLRSSWAAGAPATDQLMYVSGWTKPLVAFSASGLPPGWSTTSDGLITGTTNAVGSYPITLTASNGAGTTTSSATVTITSGTGPAAPVITGVTDDTGRPGDGVTSDLTLLVRGTAPASTTVTLYAGLLIGSAPADASGNWQIPLNRTDYPFGRDDLTATATTASGAVSPRSAIFELRLTPPPTVTWGQREWRVNEPLPTTGPVSISSPLAGITSLTAQNLPPGWTLDDRAVRISGTATTVGTYAVTITAANGAGTTTETVTVTINPASPVATPVITGISDDTGTPGDGITSDTSVTIRGTAGPNVSITVRSPNSTGIVGTAQSDATGNWSVIRSDSGGYPLGMDRWIATATDAAGNVSPASAEFHAWIVPAPSLQGASPQWAVGRNVDLDLHQIASNTGMVPVTFTAQGLPAGLSLTSLYHVAGTPTTAGSYAMTVTVANGAGGQTRTFPVKIHATYPTAAPTFSDQSASGTVGGAFSHTLNATGAWSFIADDPLPAGLVLDDRDGVISGTPTTAATTVVRIRATNPVGSTTANATVTITGGATPAGGRIVSLQRPVPGTYRPGDVIAVGVTFGAGPVQTTGSPRVSFQIGSNTRYAAARGLPDANALMFFYTLTADDADADGIALGAALDLNGGTIRSGGEAVTELNFANAGIPAATRDLSGIRVVTTPVPAAAPTIWPLTVTGTSGSAQPFSASIMTDGKPTQFSASGLPPFMQIIPTTGLIGGGGAQSISFVADVTATNALGSTTVPIKITTSGDGVDPGRLPDGNDIGSVAVSPDGVYRAGQTLTFVVDLGDPAVAVGTPRLELIIGSRTRYATQVPGNFGHALVFRYTVAADDEDADGIQLVRGIQFPEGGWTRVAPPSSMAGAPLKTHWLAHPNTSRILVGNVATVPDNTPPAAPVITGISTDTGVVGDRITFDADLIFSGTAEASSDVTILLNFPFASPITLGSAKAGANGAWSVDATYYQFSPATHAITAVATDAAGNRSAPSAVYSLTRLGTNPYGGIRVAVMGTYVNETDQPSTLKRTDFGSATVGGAAIHNTYTVAGTSSNGVHITGVTITGANAADFSVDIMPTPILWNSSGLGDAGDTGTLGIRFAPTAAGLRTATVAIANTNASLPVYTFAIQGTGVASVTTPTNPVVVIPPSGGGGGGGGGGTVTTPVVVKSNQTISFVSPVSSIFVNQPFALGATSSANLPITHTLVSGNATLAGNTITIRDTNPVRVRASQAGDASFNAAESVEISLTAVKNAQSISFAALANAPATSSPIALNATSSAGLPVTFTVTGPATLNGTTLQLNGTAGIVTVTALQAGNEAYHAATVTRSMAVGSVGSQIFFGNLGPDPFAAGILADGSKGLFLARVASSGEPIVARFALNADGSFRALATPTSPGPDSANTGPDRTTAAAGQTYTLNGTLTNGVLSGTIVELGQTFTANIQPSVGSTAAAAGVYTATVPGSASGETYIIAGPTGQAYALGVTPGASFSGTATISPEGVVTLTTPAGATLSATVTGGQVRGTVTAAGVVSTIMGLSADTARTDRLVNLSSRLRVASGDASRSVIVGFVVSGTAPKQVLVRAVGPGLAGFGVSGVLNNPGLQIFRGSTLVAENQDWSSSADVTTTGARVGAFALSAGSQDAALVATLSPGAYTAVVQANGGSGVALVEVYDAESGNALAAEELVNISTRGFVDTGDGQLIAGFVVTGNAPKRVLIRGIGPGLTQFGVPGAVSDPSLKVYASSGNTLVAQNDDWSTSQTVTATQSAATAAEIAAASTASGAFPLPASSKDAAIVITLQPGQYSAVMSGANNGTGAGLIEIYQLSP